MLNSQTYKYDTGENNTQ